MLLSKTTVLSDRNVIQVGGPDAEKLLQGVITNDMGLLAKQPAIFAALLTPQGKVLTDFFVSKAGDDFLLETAEAQAAELVKRLTLYKLRAKADIHDVTAEHAVLATWGKSPSSSGETQGAMSFPDPRLPALGLRVLAEARFAGDIAAAGNEADVSPDDYHAHRIALGPAIMVDNRSALEDEIICFGHWSTLSAACGPGACLWPSCRLPVASEI